MKSSTAWVAAMAEILEKMCDRSLRHFGGWGGKGVQISRNPHRDDWELSHVVYPGTPRLAIQTIRFLVDEGVDTGGVTTLD